MLHTFWQVFGKVIDGLFC